MPRPSPAGAAASVSIAATGDITIGNGTATFEVSSAGFDVSTNGAVSATGC